jgi:hypothetical protein
MYTYKVAYQLRMGTIFAEVLDFPEATAFGPSLEVARAGILGALRYNAERRLRRGESLPPAQPGRTAPDAYVVEQVTVTPYGQDRVDVQLCR